MRMMMPPLLVCCEGKTEQKYFQILQRMFFEDGGQPNLELASAELVGAALPIMKLEETVFITMPRSTILRKRAVIIPGLRPTPAAV